MLTLLPIVTHWRTVRMLILYINYLRKKIDGDQIPHLIHTVRGVGYELSLRPVALL